MRFASYYFALFFHSFLCVASIASMPAFSNADALNDKKLPKNHGYLLLRLDVEGVSPSITYQKMDRYAQPVELRFDEQREGFYLLALPAGSYEISMIKAPFFDLPFRLNTSGKDEWQFTIEKDKTNYIGLLEIDAERTSSRVNVNLHNRFAMDYASIHSQYEELLRSYGLANGRNKFDRFFEELNNVQ